MLKASLAPAGPLRLFCARPAGLLKPASYKSFDSASRILIQKMPFNRSLLAVDYFAIPPLGEATPRWHMFSHSTGCKGFQGLPLKTNRELNRLNLKRLPWTDSNFLT